MEHDLHGLVDRRVSLEPQQIKCIMKQALEGLAYLHSSKVMHRDIKGANILLNNKGEVKLADFGLARTWRGERRQYTDRVVTYWYRCPELLLGDRHYTSAIDIWSLGCCFAELLTGRPLFPKSQRAPLLELIYQKCGSPSEATWPGVTALKYYSQFAPKTQSPRRLREELRVGGL
jgi:cyclin-dependent kinase 12/13